MVLLLAEAAVMGQDSLDVRYVRDVPGGYVLYIDDMYRVGVESMGSVEGEWNEYYDTTYVAIYDNNDPAWPQRIWRGLPVVGWGVYGVEYNAFMYSSAELRDSLIYVVQSYYNVYDYPGGFLYCYLICYDWVNEDTLWLREFNYDYEGEYIRPFTYPHGLEIEEDRLAVCLGINGFHLFDISDKRNPQELYTSDRSTIDLVGIGNRLLLCDMDTLHRNEFHYLRLLDWNDPAVAIDSVFIDDPYLYNVRINSSGNRLFVGFEDSIGVWQITEEDRFEHGIGIHPGDDIYSFSVSGDTVAIGMDRRFELWSASEGNEPELLGRVEHGDPYRAIGTFLRGEWIYRENGSDWFMPRGGSIDLFHLGPVSAPLDGISLPKCFALHPPYPNPFNSQVVLSFNLPLPSVTCLSVIGVDGRVLERRSLGYIPAGNNRYEWNAENLPSGSYIIRIDTPKESRSSRINLIR